ncbi:hypothetical protein HPB50_008105 [Hyalomma asiaticum]|uniref:Uncharacterized protein n=1 Tax=Hyalomma asiaticum TaxID=266040 RepID=A0ACB7S8E4_HYAAI|nr:hypothetical protein HPB50_008105 [Hyalomma asiaticum]
MPGIHGYCAHCGVLADTYNMIAACPAIPRGACPASPGTPVQMARKASRVLSDHQDNRVPMANVGREDSLVKEDEPAYQAHRESAASLGHRDMLAQG